VERLEDMYGDLMAALPTAEESDFILNADTCVRPPLELETEGLVVRGMPDASIYSDSVRAEVVELFAEKDTYRALGLWIFSSIFHSARSVLHLRHSGVREIQGDPIYTVVVDNPRRADAGPLVSELVSTPTAYGYWPTIRDTLNPLYDPVGIWPWRPDLPQVNWSDESGQLLPSPKARRVLHGFGLPEGAAKFAALLLDIGLPTAQQTRFALEGPAGYQSVTSRSAEVRLWIGYDRH
jgi:hypothetical protein